MRSSASMRTVSIIEASSTARTAPAKSARPRASRSGSDRSPKRVKKYCSVREGHAGLPGENPSGDGRRRPGLAVSSAPREVPSRSRSMVVLPLPAWPCTPITRSSDRSTVRTASRVWPRVRRDAPSRASTVSAPASADLLPRPARINASTRRSVRTDRRSVTKTRSISPAFRLDELVPPSHKPCDRRVDLGQRVAPRCMAQRHRPDLALRDRGAPLRNMRHRPHHRLQNAQLRLRRQRRRRPRARARGARSRHHSETPSRGSLGSAGALLRLRTWLDGMSGAGTRGDLTRSPVSGPRGRDGVRAIVSRTSPSARAPRAPLRHEVTRVLSWLRSARMQRRNLHIPQPCRPAPDAPDARWISRRLPESRVQEGARVARKLEPGTLPTRVGETAMPSA